MPKQVFFKPSQPPSNKYKFAGDPKLFPPHTIRQNTSLDPIIVDTLVAIVNSVFSGVFGDDANTAVVIVNTIAVYAAKDAPTLKK